MNGLNIAFLTLIYIAAAILICGLLLIVLGYVNRNKQQFRYGFLIDLPNEMLDAINKARTIFLSCLLIFLSPSTTVGQQALYDTNNVVITPSSPKIYTGLQNNFIIGLKATKTHQSGSYTTMLPLKALVVKSSQGTITGNDGMYWVSGLKKGTVTIDVFRNADTGQLPLASQTFSVIEQKLSHDKGKLSELPVKPQLTLEGYSPGKIPISILTKATELKINKPFKIKRAIFFYFNQEPWLKEFQNGKFNDEILNFIKRLGSGHKFIIEEISVIDAKGQVYYLPPISFEVVND